MKLEKRTKLRQMNNNTYISTDFPEVFCERIQSQVDFALCCPPHLLE